MKYSVKFKKPTTKEAFEINQDNIVEIHIQNKYGKNITEQCKVVAYLGKDAMIGLGKSLIRRATGYYNRGNPMHLDPIRYNHIIQAYGIYLHPMSIATIIGDNSSELITEYAENPKIGDIKTTAYTFELECPNREQWELEDFERNDANIACFQVFDLKDNNISDQIVYVNIWFIQNSLIGFGSELIRLAHDFEEGKEVPIVPASKETGAQQSMGIYLTPDSCELIIKCQSFGPIDSVLEEYKKSLK